MTQDGALIKRNLPNFLLVGTARSGTTSLNHYLKQHPEIYLPMKKECRFFSNMRGNFKGPGDDESVNKKLIKSVEEYKSVFFDINNEKAIGDISPEYLYYGQESIKNIKKILGDEVSILIILRNPVERAYSSYLYFIRSGRETLSFEDALQQERSRTINNWEWGWHYKAVGYYHDQVEAYLKNFERVKILLFDDLRNNPKKLLKNVFAFLGVNSTFTPDTSIRYRASGIPKSMFIYNLVFRPNLLKSVIKLITVPFFTEERKFKVTENIAQTILIKPQMKPETREFLKNLYREDIIKLQGLINKNLIDWID